MFSHEKCLAYSMHCFVVLEDGREDNICKLLTNDSIELGEYNIPVFPGVITSSCACMLDAKTGFHMPYIPRLSKGNCI